MLFAGRGLLRGCKNPNRWDTTFAANHTTEPCPSGRGPFPGLFSAAEAEDSRKLRNKANLEYKPNYVNNLARHRWAEKGSRKGKSSPRIAPS